MGYTVKFEVMNSIYDPSSGVMNIPGSGMKIVNTSFVSDTVSGYLFSGDDYSIRENISFSYPVFIPAGASPGKVILLLHGLNERSWKKYLTWAYCLAAETGSKVILFPISFHINRAPISWKDPRAMLKLLKDKITTRGEVRSSSFANIALSTRLSEDPRRFVRSGYQTAKDIVKLAEQIKRGEHPYVPAGSSINIFGYSIGAFLSEIILMANPDNLFEDSRLFIFCGGSVFSSMYGESKHIMDRLAYEKLFSYYRDRFEWEVRHKAPLVSDLVSTDVGMVFRAMLGFNRFRDKRESLLRKLEGRIKTVTITGDTVVPAIGVLETLGRFCNVDIIDFPAGCTHENPFPILSGGAESEVDRSFDKVFQSACSFLSS